MEGNSTVGTILALVIGPVVTILGVGLVRWNREIGSSQRQSNIRFWGWDWGSEEVYQRTNILIGVGFVIGGIGITAKVIFSVFERFPA